MPTGQFKPQVISHVAVHVRRMLYSLDWNDPRATAVLVALNVVAARVHSTDPPAQLISEAISAGYAAANGGLFASLPNGGWHYSEHALVQIGTPWYIGYSDAVHSIRPT